MKPERTRLVDDLMPRAAGAYRTRSSVRVLALRFGERQRPLFVRCAWCGRIEIAGRFVAPLARLGLVLPSRLADRATHSICPDCLERTNRAAALEREQRSGRLP